MAIKSTCAKAGSAEIPAPVYLMEEETGSAHSQVGIEMRPEASGPDLQAGTISADCPASFNFPI